MTTLTIVLIILLVVAIVALVELKAKCKVATDLVKAKETQLASGEKSLQQVRKKYGKTLDDLKKDFEDLKEETKETLRHNAKQIRRALDHREVIKIKAIADCIKMSNIEFGRAHLINSRVEILKMRNILIETVLNAPSEGNSDKLNNEIKRLILEDPDIRLSMEHVQKRLGGTEIHFDVALTDK